MTKKGSSITPTHWTTMQQTLIKKYGQFLERPGNFIERTYNDSKHGTVLIFQDKKRDIIERVISFEDFKKELNEVIEKWKEIS